MKRVLALVLTVVMLVSCMVFTALPTSAAAAVHSVTLSNCDYSLEGLNGFSVPHDDLVIEGEEGSYVIRKLKAHLGLPFLNYPNVKWMKVKRTRESSIRKRTDSTPLN